MGEMTQRPHALTVEGRAKCTVTGVQDVESFNEQMIVLMTTEGALTLLGDGLRIGTFSVSDGRLIVEGKVTALSYEEPKPKGALLSRMFR